MREYTLVLLCSGTLIAGTVWMIGKALEMVVGQIGL